MLRQATGKKRLSIRGSHTECANGVEPDVAASAAESGRRTALRAEAPGDMSSPFFRLTRIASFFGLAAIVVLSLVPGEWRFSTGLAKAFEHGIAYCMVAALLTMASRGGLWPIPVLIGLAGILEFGQFWVPGRDANVSDFFASSSGTLVGSGLAALILAGLQRLSTIAADCAQPAISKPFPLKVSTLTILAAGVVAVAVSIVVAPDKSGWLGAGLALVMLAIAASDVRRFIIPDSMNVAGLALGVVHAIAAGEGNVGAALAEVTPRAAALALLFLGLRLSYARIRGRQGIGLGDVKLSAVAGTWLGWSTIPIVIEIAAVSALLFSALRWYVLRRPLRPTNRLPFGLFFAPAIWLGWLLEMTVLHGW